MGREGEDGAACHLALTPKCKLSKASHSTLTSLSFLICKIEEGEQLGVKAQPLLQLLRWSSRLGPLKGGLQGADKRPLPGGGAWEHFLEAAAGPRRMKTIQVERTS